MVPGSQPCTSESGKIVDLNLIGDQEDAEAVNQDVTRQISVKSPRSTQVLETGVVLRRIRQRKRMNKFRAVIGAVFSSPFGDKTDKIPSRERKWVDDPFAAL